jgi:hypothetical protein
MSPEVYIKCPLTLTADRLEIPLDRLKRLTPRDISTVCYTILHEPLPTLNYADIGSIADIEREIASGFAVSYSFHSKSKCYSLDVQRGLEANDGHQTERTIRVTDSPDVERQWLHALPNLGYLKIGTFCEVAL